jgi:hypothetical protein
MPWVVVIGKREAVPRLQPTMVAAATLAGWAQADHRVASQATAWLVVRSRSPGLLSKRQSCNRCVVPL